MRFDDRHVALVREALEVAREAHVSGDLPIGALVVGPDGVVVARGRNEREATGDPTAHAEIVAIRAAAAALGTSRLDGCTLVSTLEPCAMCAGAILQAHLDAVVYGAWDDKAGAVGSVYDLLRDRRLPARVDVVAGVLAEECAAPVRAFFRDRPGPDGEASSPVV